MLNKVALDVSQRIELRFAVKNMPVYVDNARKAFRRMKLCHMLADTAEELHSMADKIGMERCWFQNQRVPHYDVSMGQRCLAIRSGAIAINRKKTVELIRKYGWHNKGRKRLRAKSA